MKRNHLHSIKTKYSFLKNSIFACSCIAILFYILFLYQYIIYQNTILIGIFSEQLDFENALSCVNLLFSSGFSNTSAHQKGLLLLQNAGYSSTYRIFLTMDWTRMTLLFFLILLVLFLLFLFIKRFEKRNIKNEIRSITSWINGNSQTLPSACYTAESILFAISLLKEKLQNQKRIHEADTERMMHYMEDISHQLKTPLAVIRVICEKLSLQDTKHSGSMDKCLQQVDKMSSMIHDLLQLGKFDCRKFVMKFSFIKAYELLETLVNDLDNLAFRKNLEFIIHGNPETLWLCDIFWMKEIIGNVLKNCIEHSQDGEILLSYAETDTMHHISIQDCGSGFSAGQEKRIFDRYSLGDREKQEGTGLGLAIAQQAIQLHFGSITAKNRLEGGAEFIITFPKLDANTFYK